MKTYDILNISCPRHPIIKMRMDKTTAKAFCVICRSKMNETSLDWTLISRVREHIDERKVIADALKVHGPVVIDRLLNLDTWETSLRQLARDADVSPTYLSRIHRGQLYISPGLFLILSDLLRKRTGIIGLTDRTKREQAKGRCLRRKDLQQ